jgi:hypothetical protein
VSRPRETEIREADIAESAYREVGMTGAGVRQP